MLHDRPFGFGQGEYPPAEDMVAAGWSHGAPLVEYGAFLFEYMRTRKRPDPAHPNAEPIYSIGGHLDLTVVRSDGYEHRRLLTWLANGSIPVDVTVPLDDATGQK
ncbi:hypothetical protein HFO07_30515 [Rhizobium leguminosarum]|uniref:hypothetical protein n=1 Tax=Rhizobium leguminosarum TaxID=384 RepID=UPI001C95F188|nr:hypothetical protein [Rhizobium leguminosarum]MBY5760929.1 hypothetical protein [Rhizobium leguminosarum]